MRHHAQVATSYSRMGTDLMDPIFQKGTEELVSRVKSRDEARREEPRDVPSAERIDFFEEVEQPTGDAPTLLMVCGSPRKHTSASLMDLVERGARSAGARTERFMLCEKRIDPCIGCGGCDKTGECAFRGGTVPGAKGPDDYDEFSTMLDAADGLAVFAPVYFAGPTAQLKALYDRLQPYWVRKYLLGHPFPERRPSQLYVVGTGGDPHGNEPLLVISKSALQIAGFELEKVNNFIGYLAPSDAPKPYSEEELETLRPGEISARREAVAKQSEFMLRAVEAGRAFGRMLCHEGSKISEGETDDADAGV